MTLALFQEQMIAALKKADPDGSELAKIPYIKGSALAAQQFEVYRNQMLAHARGLLAQTFPTVQKVLGQEEFEKAAHAFLLDSNTEHNDPSAIGESFPLFLETYPLDCNAPYLPDLASLEFGYQQSYRSAELATVSTNVFTELSPEQLAACRVKLHPGCFWLCSPYAIYDVWRKHHAHEPPAGESFQYPQDVIIVRPALQVEVHRIDKGFAQALDALDEGQPFDQALLAGSKQEPNFNAVAAMQFLIQNNVILSLY